jgi:hypothetical protein
MQDLSSMLFQMQSNLRDCQTESAQLSQRIAYFGRQLHEVKEMFKANEVTLSELFRRACKEFDAKLETSGCLRKRRLSQRKKVKSFCLLFTLRFLRRGGGRLGRPEACPFQDSFESLE